MVANSSPWSYVWWVARGRFVWKAVQVEWLNKCPNKRLFVFVISVCVFYILRQKKEWVKWLEEHFDRGWRSCVAFGNHSRSCVIRFKTVWSLLKCLCLLGNWNQRDSPKIPIFWSYFHVEFHLDTFQTSKRSTFMGLNGNLAGCFNPGSIILELQPR